MTTVLVTESNGFDIVFTREVETCAVCHSPEPNESLRKVANYNEFCPNIQICNERLRVIQYHPRPGSAEAVGHWSRLEDAGWRRK